MVGTNAVDDLAGDAASAGAMARAGTFAATFSDKFAGALKRASSAVVACATGASGAVAALNWTNGLPMTRAGAGSASGRRALLSKLRNRVAIVECRRTRRISGFLEVQAVRLLMP
jgi:hypothetical protein